MLVLSIDQLGVVRAAVEIQAPKQREFVNVINDKEFFATQQRMMPK